MALECHMCQGSSAPTPLHTATVGTEDVAPYAATGRDPQNTVRTRALGGNNEECCPLEYDGAVWLLRIFRLHRQGERL
jgi:hypothetical protein